jgi:hypothetical protein
MQLLDSSIESKTPSNLLDLTGNPRMSNAEKCAWDPSAIEKLIHEYGLD